MNLPTNDIIDDLMRIATNIEDGNLDPLKGYIAFQQIEKTLKSAKAQVKEQAINEAQKYDKTFELDGFVITRTEGTRRYNFKNVPQWASLKEKLTEVETLSKNAAVSQGKGVQMVTEDGEVIQAAELTWTEPSLTIKPKF